MKSTNNKKFSFPPEAEIKKVLERTEQPNYHRVNIGLHPDATPTDKAKYKLCKTIARYEREKKLSEQELARKLGITHAQVEKILFCHIDKLNLEELMNLAGTLALSLEINSRDNLVNVSQEHA